MKVHHLDLCTMCPFGGRLIDGGEGTIFAAARMVAHALVVESNDGLVLVDTGLGLDDVKSPVRRLGPAFVALCRPRLAEAHTAIRQIEALGLRPEDVRHVVVTHLDVDHAGGIADFPRATVHVHRAEHAAMTARATRNERERYRKAHFAHGPIWELHEPDGERWLGFERVRAVGDDVLMIPLHGHTRGHCAVAVRAPANDDGTEWLLHCGDAYFHHGQLEAPPRCPPALDLFQRTMAIDDEARLANTARLAELHAREGAGVRLFSAHDPHELRAMQARQPAGARERRGARADADADPTRA
jgi:glyoxylase-like metal-dependent hydrolase (beta-lactamase superfamily II)